MTTTLEHVADAATRPHPAWCANPGCGGDHLGQNLFVQATGDEPQHLSTDGAFFKSLCVAATHDEDAGEPLGVLLSICSVNGSEFATLRPGEAKQLIEVLGLVLGQIDGAR